MAVTRQEMSIRQAGALEAHLEIGLRVAHGPSQDRGLRRFQTIAFSAWHIEGLVQTVCLTRRLLP